MSINKVILVGNVGKDPVVRYFEKGVAKATFPLATSETYTNQQGETITNTEWHNIVLWRSLAEVAEKTAEVSGEVVVETAEKSKGFWQKTKETTKSWLDKARAKIHQMTAPQTEPEPVPQPEPAQ